MIIPYKNYKNIIFDLGGVILNIDYSLTVEEFIELGITDFKKLFSQAKQNHFFDLMDKGTISPDDFRTEMKKHLKSPVEDYRIDEAWNAMLLDLPNERLDVLNQIKATHRIFLLSNTNKIHIDAFHLYLEKDFGIPDLSAYFEKMYFSYKVGMRKPDAEIFKLVLHENNLQPYETLFIDDSAQHIEGAKKLGIETYWLDTTKESITDIFV